MPEHASPAAPPTHANPASSRPVAAESGQPLAAVPHCIRCGYTLEGLSEASRCSECGVLVARSLHGNLLAYAEPRYLLTLAIGARLVQLAILGVCLMIFAAVGVAISMDVLERLVKRLQWGIGPTTLILVGITGPLVALSGVAICGWFLLSAPDPAFVGQDRSRFSRAITRWASVLGAVCVLSLLALAFMPMTTLLWPSQVETLWTGVWITLGVVVPVQIVASLTYIGVVLGRIPDVEASTRARVLRWLLMIAAALAIVIVVGGRGVGPAAMASLAFIIIGVLSIFAVRYTGVIERFRRHAKRLAAGAPTID